MVNLVGDWKVIDQVLFSFSQYNGNDLLRNHQIIREWRVRVYCSATQGKKGVQAKNFMPSLLVDLVVKIISGGCVG